MSKKDERKERVIHTRISETLEQELKARASRLGVSVSNLVRNVLLNTFGLVEGVARDSASVARAVTHEPDQAEGGDAESPEGWLSAALSNLLPAHQSIIGWQTLVLAVNAVCARCNAVLASGSDAAIGVSWRSDAPRPIVCLECLGELRGQAEPR